MRNRPIRPAKSKLPPTDPIVHERLRYKADYARMQDALDAAHERIEELQRALAAGVGVPPDENQDLGSALHKDRGDAREFRKRPVVVHAMQLTSDDDLTRAEKWMDANHQESRVSYDDVLDETVLLIETLEGQMLARWTVGDWIIRGVQGEFYACKPDIFAATYEPLASEASAAEGRKPNPSAGVGEARPAEPPTEKPSDSALGQRRYLPHLEYSAYATDRALAAALRAALGDVAAGESLEANSAKNAEVRGEGSDAGS